MKRLKWLLIGVVALLLLFAAVSLALASQVRDDRSVATAAPVEKVLPPVAAHARRESRTVTERSEPVLQTETAAPDCAAGLDDPTRRAATP